MDDSAAKGKPPLLGKILLDEGMITEDKLSTALDFQRSQPERFLGEILVERGLLSRSALLRALDLQVSRYNALIDHILWDAPGGKNGPAADVVFFQEHRAELVTRTKASWERVDALTQVSLADLQHAWLLMLGHYARLTFRGRDGSLKLSEVKRSLDIVLSYAQEHFWAEERLIQLIGARPTHAAQHRDFVRHISLERGKILSVTADTQDSLRPALAELCDYIIDWCLSHFATWDRGYARKLMRMEDRYEVVEKWIAGLKESGRVGVPAVQKDFFADMTGQKVE